MATIELAPVTTEDIEFDFDSIFDEKIVHVPARLSIEESTPEKWYSDTIAMCGESLGEKCCENDAYVLWRPESACRSCGTPICTFCLLALFPNG